MWLGFQIPSGTNSRESLKIQKVTKGLRNYSPTVQMKISDGLINLPMNELTENHSRMWTWN